MDGRKRQTMQIDSDEDEDLFGELNQPKPKKKKKDTRITDIADGPSDFMETLTDAGFFPRKGNLPNLLSNFQVYPFNLFTFHS